MFSSKETGRIQHSETAFSVTVHTGLYESTFTKEGSFLDRTDTKTTTTFVGPYDRDLADAYIARWALSHGCTTIRRNAIEYTLAYDSSRNIQVFHCGLLQTVFCKPNGSKLNRALVKLRNQILPGGVNFL